jgi:hypothetical protein
VTATGARIAAPVTAAGCLWPDPCACCSPDGGHVGDEGTDESFAREIDRMDWPDGEVPDGR